MQGRWSLETELEPIDGKIERTFHQRKQATVEDKIEHSIVEAKMGEKEQEKSFKDYFSPLANLSTTCIQYPQVAARSFELKPNVLNYLPSLYGLDSEEPHNHLNDFYASCE